MSTETFSNNRTTCAAVGPPVRDHFFCLVDRWSRPSVGHPSVRRQPVVMLCGPVAVSRPVHGRQSRPKGKSTSPWPSATPSGSSSVSPHVNEAKLCLADRRHPPSIGSSDLGDVYHLADRRYPPVGSSDLGYIHNLADRLYPPSVYLTLVTSATLRTVDSDRRSD